MLLYLELLPIPKQFPTNYHMPPSQNTISLAITGASGGAYGLRLLECLLTHGQSVYLMVSKPALLVLRMECGLPLPGRAREMQQALCKHFQVTKNQLRVFAKEQWTAPVASGSGAPRAMIVCPCTMGSLAAIASGYSRTLIERAADVILKEGKLLILVPREAPFSSLHLENMLKLSRMGTVILPANPGFYHNPTNIQGLVDFVVARILDQLAIPHQLISSWGQELTDDHIG